MQDYGISESFFKEIDASVKKQLPYTERCTSLSFHVSGILQRPDDVNGQLDAMEIPYAFHLQRRITQHDRKTVHEVCTKTVWKKDDVHKTAMTVRQYKERLGYSEQWMTEYVYNIVMLAKKEPKKKGDEQEKA